MMNAILVKIFATALTLSQITTRPDDIQVSFDPTTERQEVAELLGAGCRHMIKVFDVEDINIDDLLATAMDDPAALSTDIKALNGLNLNDLFLAYKEFCKGEKVETSSVDIAAVIDYYNKSVADLPDPAKLKGMRLPGSSLILDVNGERFTEVYERDHRRIWLPVGEMPKHLIHAFIAAEDKRFFEHEGIDERSIVRAFMHNFASSGRPQGGSTISQQVAKNLLVGDDITYERKMKEMIAASRLEKLLSKDEIIELYANQVFLGRASWGVEMAARSYFGKSARDLTLRESALMAALVRGPNYYSPERHPQRVEDRVNYVLNRMREDGYITAEQMKAAQGQTFAYAEFESPRTRGGFYFVDQVVSAAETWAGIPDLTKDSFTVKSTIHPDLQKATEAALQEGLAKYELESGRFQFSGPERNLGEAIAKLEAAAEKAAAAKSEASGSKSDTSEPAIPFWRQALESARMPLYDVHWSPAIVLQKARTRNGGEVIRVGLKDGRIVPLKTWTAAIRRSLKIHDVVHVKVIETKRSARAELRVRPNVQGAALVLENRTGRILAMAGGFSYPLSQFNRAMRMKRQPGSAIKPLVYLGALNNGLQPNTLVQDAPITLPPVEQGGKSWTPKNYDGQSSGLLTVRRALELSKNYVTARLLDGGVSSTPDRSMDALCEAAKEIGVYESCVKHYPFILGAQPVRMMDLAVFYATIANEGLKPTPHVIEYVDQGGRRIYEDKGNILIPVRSIDSVAFYQMKTFLQGVLQRGTARRIKHLSPYVGGKTGTTDRENDAWFVGFTNELTVAVWVGYDNASKRRTLGGGFTGGTIAVPIFDDIIKAAWTDYAQRTVLAPPSSRSRDYLRNIPIDLATGERLDGWNANAEFTTVFNEHFRLNLGTHRLEDTQYRLASRSQYAGGFASYPGDEEAIEDLEWGFSPEVSQGRLPQDRSGSGFGFGRTWEQPYYRAPERYVEPPMTDSSERRGRRPRKVDPDYLWQDLF